MSPDDFLVYLTKEKAVEVLSGTKAHRVSLKNPPFTPKDYIQARRKQGLKEIWEILKKRGYLKEMNLGDDQSVIHWC